MKRCRLLVACLSALPLAALAQEPTFMEAGTHPGSGQWYGRTLWTSPALKDGAQDGLLEIKSAYGLTARRALLTDLAFDEDGFAAAGLRWKQRVLQRDTGPIDTWRASAQGGAEWLDGRDPGGRAGLVSTTIRGRHGVNLQLDWRGGVAAGERFALDASHLYRLHPRTYSAHRGAAWYTMLESLNRFSPDADRSSDVAAGLLYEARRWAAEFSLRLQEPEDGLARDQARLGLGVRALW